MAGRIHIVAAGLLAAGCILVSFLSPKGWHTSGNAESKYEMGSIRYNGHQSKSCGTIKAIKNHYLNDEYGLLMQSFSAEHYLGKHIRMTAWMKTRNVTDWAGLLLRVNKEGVKQPLYFDNMADRKITGSGDWREYHVEADVPSDATSIVFGALLNGDGQIWFDDFGFEIAGTAGTAADTERHLDASLRKEPENLDFEK